MILFHLNITSMFPLAVPLEWNLFMIFGLLFLFGHYGDTPLSTLDDPLLIAVLAVPLHRPAAARRHCGRTRSPSCPRCATTPGNWATTAVALPQGERGGGEARHPDQEAGADHRRAGRGHLRPRDGASLLLNKGLSFRAMHSHGRALNGLLPHAVDDVEDYDVREGELISNIVNGWNFGDAHFHGRAAARGGPGALLTSRPATCG